MQTGIKTISFAILAMLLLAGCAAVLRVPASNVEPVRRVELMMDTIVSITAYGDRETASCAINAAFDAMRSVDAMASFFQADSELSKWNTERVIVPTASFSRLLKAVSAGYERSGGVFDPSCAVLAEAWGFYDHRGRIPADSEIRECLSRTGWERQIHWATQSAPLSSGAAGLIGGVSVPGAVSLASGARIDLGGVAGGMAIQAAADAMRRRGCKTFIIDDGGDLWMEGNKPDGRPWRVAVKDPLGAGSIAMIETKQPIAVSTSGDYERFVDVNGKRYTHIFDVKTGRPADSFRSVTVISSSALDGDILSTTLFAMASETSREFAVREHIAAMMIPASGPLWLSPAAAGLFQIVNQ
ncbi:MAG TPA: FAD:protein FMN transferase [Candidatus Ozemobacteraceae bacterium]|nr:FAD:protein FMN transferase [Candidatus Ozemobacteraceae bacterium]